MQVQIDSYGRNIANLKCLLILSSISMKNEIPKYIDGYEIKKNDLVFLSRKLVENQKF